MYNRYNKTSHKNAWLLRSLLLTTLSFPMATQALTMNTPKGEPYDLRSPKSSADSSTLLIVWDKPLPTLAGTIDSADYEVYIDDKLAGLASDNFKKSYPYTSSYIDSFYSAEGMKEHYKIVYNSFLATGLKSDTSYEVKVRTRFKDGTFSPFSKTKILKTTKNPIIVNPTDKKYGVLGSKLKNVTVGGGTEDQIAAIKRNTKALQAAIDNCPEGCKLILPGSGNNEEPIYYMSGALFLHSHMTFEIEEGASLVASPNFDDYQRTLLVYPYSQDIRTYGLINAVTEDYCSEEVYSCPSMLKEIRIVGKGSIDGNGWQYADADKKYQEQNALDPQNGKLKDPTGNGWKLYNYYAGSKKNVSKFGILAADAFNKSTLDKTPNAGDSQFYNTRPNLIVTRGVDGLYYNGLTFYNPAFHGIVQYHSKNITANGIQVMTFNANNGDGIEFGDSRQFYVMNSFFDTGDDAINFAAGQGALARNLTKKVASGEGVIFNNFIRNGHGGIIAAGSHTGGWIGDILAENNVYNSSESGNAGVIRLKSGAITGGGIRNIVFRDSAINYSHAEGKPVINIDTAYKDSNASTAFSPESEYPLTFKNIEVQHLTISNVGTRKLMEIKKPSQSKLAMTPVISDFFLQDIHIIGDDKGGDILLNSLTHGVFVNINRPIKLGNDNKNLFIDHVSNRASIETGITKGVNKNLNLEVLNSALQFPKDSFEISTESGNLLTLNYPMLKAETGDELFYHIMVDGGNGFKERLVTKDNMAKITLEPNKDYKIGIQVTNSLYKTKIQLVKTITTGDLAPSLMAPTLPEDKKLTASTSGSSWIGYSWNKAIDEINGIQYYQITATPEDKKQPIKSFKAYFDSEQRSGYALSNLDSGTTYTVTIRAVNWAGLRSEYYEPHTFTTVPHTLVTLPQWKGERAKLSITKKDSKIILSWDENSLITHADPKGIRSKFAGYRISIDGVMVQPLNGELTEINATPTTVETTYELPVALFKADAHYTIKVDAGNELLQYASGHGGLSGSSDFRGQDRSLLRNQVTFGLWSNSGITADLYLPNLESADKKK